jgi:hypothetical protein
MGTEDRSQMNILLVHQNFPGQYRELFRWLIAQRAHKTVFLTQRTDVGAVEGAEIVVYKTHHKAAKDAYALSTYWEDCVGNGYGAAKACETLRDDGFRPDIILGHVGWGELTFVKQVWPDVPVIGLFEYFFLASGGSVGFDPEFPAGDQAPYTMHARNAVNFANIETVDLGYSPTRWQRDTFPQSFHHKLYVCHDGIRTDLLRPDAEVSIALGRMDRPLSRQDEVVTYVARNLEPVRGFHVFMRALPDILGARPQARPSLSAETAHPTAGPATKRAATAPRWRERSATASTGTACIFWAAYPTPPTAASCRSAAATFTLPCPSSSPGR